MFDLDGTLLDTLQDLADSMNAVLSRLGLPTHPPDSYRYFVGRGREHLVAAALPKNRRNPETITECVTAMDREYGKRWAQNSKPYPGIPALLSGIDTLGVTKAVLSNKSDEFVCAMVKKLLGQWSFAVIRGAKPNVPLKPDPAAALGIADDLGIAADKWLYLGDSDIDMQTANSAGMYAAGALWGFRTANELASAGSKVLVQTPLEVLELLNKPAE